MRKTMKTSQKVWNMKGCSKTKRNLGKKHKRSGGCWLKKRGGSHKCTPRCNHAKKHRTRRQRGGNCGCGLQLGGCTSCLVGGVQMGGGSAALVGAPWTASTKGNENYYSQNMYNKGDPQTSMMSERDQQTFKGGSRKRRAGGFIPDDLVNLGRSMVYGMGSAYNTLNGYSVPANPLPYKDQLVSTPSAKAMGY
jgi:hypothetical protein